TEAEARMVGRADGLFFSIERANAYHRAEDFFVPDPAVFRYIGEDGRLQGEPLVQVRRTLATRYQAGAFFQAAGYRLQGVVVLAAVDQWAEQHAFFHAIADLDLARLLGKAGQQRLVRGALHQHARGGGADFAL